MFVKSTIALSTQRYEDLSVVLDILAVFALLSGDGSMSALKDSCCCFLKVFLGNMTGDCDVNAVVLADVVRCRAPYVIASFSCVVAFALRSANR